MGEAVDSVGEEEGGQAWAEPPFAGPALPFLPGPPGLFGHAQPLPSASFSCFPAASGRWLLTPRTGHAQLALSLSLLYHLKKGHPG